MKNILILKLKNDDMFFNKLENINKYYFCKQNFLPYRISNKFNFGRYLFFDNWKRELHKYDKVIMFDSGFNKDISKYIKKKNPNIKTILWYWNSISEHHNKLMEDENIDEIWTYNRFEADKYKIKYAPQFYYYNEDYYKGDIESDVLFLGRDKGRAYKINEFEKKLKENNIITHFSIVKESNYISYDEYLEKVRKTKCIFDYNYELPSGLSLRPLEAIFFKKKLITNNDDIINYEFYNPNNIFIIGKDDESKLYEFINSKFIDIDENIMKKYTFKKWLENF